MFTLRYSTDVSSLYIYIHKFEPLPDPEGHRYIGAHPDNRNHTPHPL
jgi:hypothetical protein